MQVEINQGKNGLRYSAITLLYIFKYELNYIFP